MRGGWRFVRGLIVPHEPRSSEITYAGLAGRGRIADTVCGVSSLYIFKQTTLSPKYYCYGHEALFVNQGSGSDSAGNTAPDLKPAEGASPSDLLRRRRLSSTGTTSPHLSYQLHVGGWSLTLMCRQAVHAAQRRRHALAASRHVRLLPTTSEPYEPPARAVGVRGYLGGTLRRWKARACACTAGAGGSGSE